MFHEVKLNNITVKPVVTQDENTVKNVRGYKLIPQSIFTLFVCARKKSGKTSVINLLLNKCCDKRTVIWIFCSTYRIDPTWLAIIKMLKDRGNLVNCYDSIMDGKENILQSIVDGLSNDIDEPEPEPEKVTSGIKLKFEDHVKKKKEYKPKKIASENCFVFDDISTQLKNPAITALLKVHRHTKSSIIISSQYLHDINPASILQLDYFLMFRSFSKEKVEIIHKLLDISIPLERFWSLYKHCSEKPYSFLYFSIRDEKARCKFDTEIKMDEIADIV